MIAVRGKGPAGIIRVRRSDGVVEVAEGRVRTRAGLSVFFSRAAAMAVSGTRSVFGAQSSSGPIAVTTQATTLTVEGGTAPFTYAWAGTAPDWAIATPSKLNTSFTASAVPQYESKVADFTLRITDARGAEVTATVTATADNFGGGGLQP